MKMCLNKMKIVACDSICDWIWENQPFMRFIVLWIINIQVISYNSVVVSNKSMGLALEIKHVCSFK